MTVDLQVPLCPSCNAQLAAASSVLQCGSCHAQFRRDQDGNIVGFRVAGAAEAARDAVAFVRLAAASVLVVASLVLLLIGLVLSFVPGAIAGVVCMATAVGISSARGPWSLVVGVVLAVATVAVLAGIYAVIGAAVISK